MKVPKIYGVFLWLLCVSILAMPLYAGEWTEEQKEVWKTVESYSKIAAEGDVEGFLNYFHPDFLGWAYSQELPTSKKVRSKYIRYYYPNFKNLFYDIRPVGVKVFGNAAFVHYYFYSEGIDSDGKKVVSKGRWTDILMKEGDKWLMIGDHGGETK